MPLALIIVLAIILAIDVYGFYGLRKFFAYKRLRPYRRKIIIIYWLMDVAFIVFSIVWTIIIRKSEWPDYIQYRNFFYITGAFLLIFLPKLTFLIFNVLHDFYLVITWLLKKANTGVTRRDYVLKPSVLLSVGFILSLLMFSWVFYGVAFGRYNFVVEEVEVPIENLPESFDGFRIVQFSDTHLGSFSRYSKALKGFRKIKDTPHDLLLFTGDMVNNEAVEAEKYVDYLAGIESAYGKFSILGNHDMGDYRRWYTIDEKDANLQQLEEYHQEMGFKLLRNEHRFIVRGNDSIMIAGVDNWGEPPFAQLGDLQEATGENNNFPFIILLSHDPSHWTEEVVPETNIMLTLSGHTHGMQVGIRTRWFQLSPVMVKYPLWNGLYNQQGQYLYVNRGFGFLGFPGRMGMPPEITLLVLRRAS
jgi:uncharacterized protein